MDKKITHSLLRRFLAAYISEKLIFIYPSDFTYSKALSEHRTSYLGYKGVKDFLILYHQDQFDFY